MSAQQTTYRQDMQFLRASDLGSIGGTRKSRPPIAVATLAFGVVFLWKQVYVSGKRGVVMHVSLQVLLESGLITIRGCSQCCVYRRTYDTVPCYVTGISIQLSVK
jgi:hypothetical protein